MKYLYIILIAFSIFGCQNTDTRLDDAEKLYSLALENKDASTSKIALQQLILLDSANISYPDSLSRIFMRSGNFDAGIKYAEMVYDAGKAGNKLKENMALAYQQIGESEKAEQFIANLLEETKDYKYLYQQLVIQYESGNQILFDSISTDILNMIETDSLVASTLVPMPGPVSGVNQMIPMKAATLFLIGNNALERKQDVRMAISYLEKSIQEFDQFEMARYVLMEIEKMIRASRR